MITQITCSSERELISKLTLEFSHFGLYISSLREFIDVAENKHFIRIDSDTEPSLGKFLGVLHPILPDDTIITSNFLPKKKIVLLVTRKHHCLTDILLRNHFDTLGADVQAVIGNHETLRNIT